MPTRRPGSRALVAACLAAWTTTLGAQAAETSRFFRYLMGTSMRVEVYGGTPTDREAAAAEGFAAMAEVDRLMSDYRADSELSRVNRMAAQERVAVSEPLFAVLEVAERVSRASSGAFDVTVGPLVRLWGFKDKRPHVPSPPELALIRDRVGFRNVTLDRTRHTVQFAKPGVEIDLGGIAKGFASELAAQSIRRRGLSGVVDAGGNQFMVGRPPGKSAWSVGIANPEAPGALLGAIEVSDGALSTSSDASNFLTAGDRRYGHLLDPRSLQPSDASLSATIVCADGTVCDALSKAVFVLGPQDGLKLLAAFPGTAAIVAYRGVDGRLAVAVSPTLRAAFHPAPGVAVQPPLPISPSPALREGGARPWRAEASAPPRGSR